MMEENSRNTYISRINKALDLIHADPAGEFFLEQLSEAACFSPFHFHRIFKAITGETPKEHIDRLRLEKSANLLVHRKDISVTEISMDCGFSSPSVFARSFKKTYGVSANHYRHSHYRNDRLNKTSFNKPSTGYRFDPALIEIQKLGPFQLAFARGVGNYGKSIDKAWQILSRWAMPRDLLQPDTVRIGIPMDNPDVTPHHLCRYCACIAVKVKIKPEGPISTTELPALKYAVYHFEGKREEIQEAYQGLYGLWLPDSGYVPANFQNIEIYPPVLPPENNSRINYDICLPIQVISL